MKQIIQSLIFLLLLGCDNAPQPDIKSPQSEQEKEVINVGFLITDGVYNTEFTAPWDIFHHTKFRDSITPMQVFSISNQSNPVKTFEEILIHPDYDFTKDGLPRIDILVVPSAEHHLDTDLEDQPLVDFIKKTGSQAKMVLSLCDGAFMLAQAGLLDSVASTTFPSDIPVYREKFSQLEVIDSTLFVHDGKFITSAGGAKSFEAALYISEYLYGAEVAKRLAKGLVIDWDLSNIPHTIKSPSPF